MRNNRDTVHGSLRILEKGSCPILQAIQPKLKEKTHIMFAPETVYVS